jgi:DNA polymerase
LSCCHGDRRRTHAPDANRRGTPARGGLPPRPLYRNAIQTVFGEGPTTAAIFLVGEQPGDEEDKQGRPFVGPAGRMLDRALTDAGIDRDAVYITNAVKHFKNEPRGKKRLHQRPNTSEIEACKLRLHRLEG